VALMAALLVFGWTAARIHFVFGGNWTAAFCTGTSFTVPPDLRAGTYRIEGAGYDGQFYRYLAHDPFLQKGYSRYVDAPRLRFRRVLVPMAAWLIALGRQGWIDSAYVAVEMIFVALGVYWCARLLARRGRSPLWGLLFVVVAGTLASVDRMLVDGPLAAIFAGFLLYCDEKRWDRVWILAMLAALTRETGLLLCVALVVDRLFQRDWRRAAWFASSAIPAMVWYGYVAARLPPNAAGPPMGVPVWGLLSRLLWFRTYPDSRIQLLLQVTDFLAVLGLAVSIVLAVRWLLQKHLGPVTLCVGLFAAVTLMIGSPEYMVEAMAFGRPTSPLLLWVMIEAISRKAWAAMAAPLLVSLSVSLVFASPLLTIIKSVLGR
jgi:hypothetical protein